MNACRCASFSFITINNVTGSSTAERAVKQSSRVMIIEYRKMYRLTISGILGDNNW